MTRDAESFLGERVALVIDRPAGSRHPKHGFLYPINYGFVPGTCSGDGEELDAYVLGVVEPLEKFEGRCIAVVRRRDESDDKLIVVPEGTAFSDAQIAQAVDFQERWHVVTIVRKTKL